MSAASTGSRTAAVASLRVVGEASGQDLANWDARTVEPPGGDVQQSRAWAAHRARSGWIPHHLLLDDGSAALALGRRWPLIGGGRLYVPRGPVAAGAGPATVAARLGAVTTWAREAGYDVVLADPEIPAASGFPALVAALGFHQVEEVGPARHRLAVPIEPGATEASLLAGIVPKTRQQLLAAERRGVVVIRHDGPARGGAGQGVEAPDSRPPGGSAGETFERFHALLAATGERRGFRIRSRSAALAWWSAALAAGHLLLLETVAPDGSLIGGAIFYRHGGRLTYAYSGDDPAGRAAHPGAMSLLLWRALQLAFREGCRELDLGGVDVPGARREPRPGEPTYGLLRFKQSLGGRWLELSGAHEQVLRPRRHALATGAGRAVRGLRAASRAWRAIRDRGLR
jgi:lipid II:glycine glycyltransferase (peptidoglycan interpeptide bridge formation enzyme)